jgi:hypothetical protein
MILLSFPLCTALALCCDDWRQNTPPPAWLRLVEGAGCGLVMAVGMTMVLIYLSDRLPFPAVGLSGWQVAMVIGFPATTAIVFGAYVPHIYRAARRAASLRREEASQSVAPVGSLTLPAVPRHGGRASADPALSQRSEAAPVMAHEAYSSALQDAPRQRRSSRRPARNDIAANGALTDDAVIPR